MMAGWGLLFRCGYAFIFQGRHGFLPIMAGVAFLVLCGY
jgi:hypothetical protein